MEGSGGEKGRGMGEDDVEEEGGVCRGRKEGGGSELAKRRWMKSERTVGWLTC